MALSFLLSLFSKCAAAAANSPYICELVCYSRLSGSQKVLMVEVVVVVQHARFSGPQFSQEGKVL